jgi:hypothetical protein
MTFADLHDVHYAPDPNLSASGYDNQGYRPSTRQSNHQDLQQESLGLPGYDMKADSVADMKRELKQRLDAESSSPEETNTTTSDTGSGSEGAAAAMTTPTAATLSSEYQTMERSPLYESSTFRPAEPRRGLPTPPPAGELQNTIPSVPGYARPYARPFQPPPDPPASKPPRSFSYAPDPHNAQDRDHRRPLLLETSLDDDTLTRRQKQPVRSRSVGQMLETNLDEEMVDQEDSDDDRGGGDNVHSRSLGGDKFPRMMSAEPNSLLESDL